MRPVAAVAPLQDVSADVGGDVRLCPALVRLQGRQAVRTQRGDPSPAAGPGGAGRRGGRGAQVDEGCSDQLLRGKSVQVVLYGEGVAVV